MTVSSCQASRIPFQHAAEAYAHPSQHNLEMSPGAARTYLCEILRLWKTFCFWLALRDQNAGEQLFHCLKYIVFEKIQPAGLLTRHAWTISPQGAISFLEIRRVCKKSSRRASDKPCVTNIPARHYFIFWNTHMLKAIRDQNATK